MRKKIIFKTFIGCVLSQTVLGETNSVFTSPFSPYYGTRLFIGDYYESKNRSYMQFDGLISLLENNSNYVFADIRNLRRRGTGYELDSGLGWRHILANREWLVGGYSYFERLKTSHNRYFN